jgi:hypothetical protein
MPSRESLKEPGWNHTTTAGTATEGAVGRTALIKPFIPPDSQDTSGASAVPTGSGLRTDPAATPPQLTAAQEAPPAEAPLTVPLQPTPRPVRWQEPTEQQGGFQEPSAVPGAAQVVPVPEERPVPDVAQRTEPQGNSLARIEASPSLPSSSSPHPPAPQLIPRGQANAPAPPVKPAAQPPTQSVQLQVPVEAKSGSREWEDQRVKEAAFKVAKEFPAVKRGKICYSVKTDEWWVVLYDDTGAVYDVKQYTWSRDQEKLEPFLVLKRIGKNRLEEDLTTREADKACEALTFPYTAP